MTLLGYIKIHQNTAKYSRIHFGGIHTLDLGEIATIPVGYMSAELFLDLPTMSELPTMC